MPSNPGADTRQPYAAGYQRQDFPELMGWSELMSVSGRTETAVRQMRGDFREDFPTPVAVLNATPVYLGEEVRAFFERHPRRRRLDQDLISRIQGLARGGTSRKEISRLLEVSLSTVGKYAN